MNGEGWLLCATVVASGTIYSLLTHQTPNFILLVPTTTLAVILVVTLGRPKRVLPSECLTFDDEDSRLQHRGREEIYGWIVGLTMVTLAVYWIFFRTG